MIKFLTQFGERRVLKRYEEIVALVATFEEGLRQKTSDELRTASEKLRDRIRAGESEEQVLPEAFALIRESSVRTLEKRHFDTQIIGGAILHEGKIAEMLTGEGKTLAATLPAYLNALSGKGVHVVTVNEYLAKRDTVWMGQIYHALGLRVTCLIHDGALMYDPEYDSDPAFDAERDIIGGFKVVEKFLRPVSRRDAYLADITYGTNHEFGFDYLRDNLVILLADCVQRGHHYAIIDEVDSILIDEARTPLIIAAPDQASSEYYRTFARIVENLQDERDYIKDEKLKTVNLTEDGISRVEKAIGVQNIFDPEHSRLIHFLQESLKAKALFDCDRDYVVKDNEIIIVDQFTGRMLHGR
ncbi:MAG: Protein translocase subunit SecA, partial [Candidatus Jorgensenbacteria bacterium GW2011_GWA2_45_13]